MAPTTLDARQLTIFVGAGISVPSGAPDFRRLRDLFLTELVGGAAVRVDVEQLSPELIFATLDDGLSRTRELVRQQLWRECERHEPGPNHLAVARLGSAGARIWTPNFDTLIERAAERLGLSWSAITTPAELAQAPEAPAAGHLLLIKPHGSFPFTGDPPCEPRRHDYELLFRTQDVWREAHEQWIDRMIADCQGREVGVYGYRGVDPDLAPALIRALPRAREVEWWELPSQASNLARLRRRFGVLGPQVQISAGDPSEQLQARAPGAAGEMSRQLTSGSAPIRTQESRLRMAVTWTTRARLRGQFQGAAAARRCYLAAIAFDPQQLKGQAVWKLLRSLGYDRPVPRRLLMGALRSCLGTAFGRRSTRLWILFATMLDARPDSSSDQADLAMLRASHLADSADVRVRIASKEKRSGALRDAEDNLELALDELRRRSEPVPGLEAMAVFNLAWVRRQRWRVAEREQLIRAYADRMPHIGFNWAAWLKLDDVFAALNRGQQAAAELALTDPFLDLASGLIRHPMFLADVAQARALLAWHAGDPELAERGLEDAISLALPLEREGRSFTAVDSHLLLADLARARGDRRRLERVLATTEPLRRSPLHRARARLLKAYAAADRESLRRLTEQGHAQGWGLIEATIAAIEAGGAAIEEGPAVAWSLPLPALY
jgi:hypothetical protein